MMAIAFKFFWVGLQALIEFCLKPANLVIAGILCLFVYGIGFVKGDNYRDAKWVARIEAEKEKQAQIVFREDNKALEDNKKLSEEVEQQNALIEKLRLEREAAPGANVPALGIDSVRRINRSGAGRP